MSKLDGIREAVNSGYDYSVETAEEHVKILLAVVDTFLMGHSVEDCVRMSEELVEESATFSSREKFREQARVLRMLL